MEKLWKEKAKHDDDKSDTGNNQNDDDHKNEDDNEDNVYSFCKMLECKTMKMESIWSVQIFTQPSCFKKQILFYNFHKM